MSENLKSPLSKDGSSPSDTAQTLNMDLSLNGVSRRRLVRAGLAAAPVMLVLKSQSALATGTRDSGVNCKTSVWASLKAAGGCRSHSPQTTTETNCRLYSDSKWGTETHADCDKKYHHKSTRLARKEVPVDDDANDDYCGVNSSMRDVCAGKKRDSNNNVTNLSDSGKDKFARHCASMVLNIRVLKSCPVDEPTVKSMWRNCKNGGVWTPPSGGTGWTRDDCNEYFDYVCGVIPSGWKTCT